VIVSLIILVAFLLQDQNQHEAESFEERYGDAVAWGGCTIVYLLGQETRFELLDFSYHVLAVAESDTLPTSLAYIEMMAHGTTSYSIVSRRILNLRSTGQLHDDKRYLRAPKLLATRFFQERNDKSTALKTLIQLLIYK